MTRLRKKMLEELQRRNYAQTTIKNYLGSVRSPAAARSLRSTSRC